jgi:hypothetical protein
VVRGKPKSTIGSFGARTVSWTAPFRECSRIVAFPVTASAPDSVSLRVVTTPTPGSAGPSISPAAWLIEGLKQFSSDETLWPVAAFRRSGPRGAPIGPKGIVSELRPCFLTPSPSRRCLPGPRLRVRPTRRATDLLNHGCMRAERWADAGGQLGPVVRAPVRRSCAFCTARPTTAARRWPESSSGQGL